MADQIQNSKKIKHDDIHVVLEAELNKEEKGDPTIIEHTQKINDLNSRILEFEKDKSEINRNALINFAMSIFNCEAFCLKINEEIYFEENHSKYQFLNQLVEPVILEINANIEEDLTENMMDKTLINSAIEFMLVFSNLKIKRYLKIRSTHLKKIFSFVDLLHESCTNNLLSILLNLSESNKYGQIEFDEPLTNLQDLIEHLKDAYPTHSVRLDKINKNLKEKSIQDRLENFKVIYNQNENVLELIRENYFFDDLLFVAKVLNGDHNEIEYFYLEIFKRCDSFKFFSKVLEIAFEDLKYLYINDDTVDAKVYQIRDLLEIMSKFVQGSFLFNEHFLEQGVFEIIANLMSDHGLLEFLFDAHIKLVCKVICVFYCISKTTYYLDKDYIKNFVNWFEALRKTRDFLEELTSEKNGKPRNVTEKPVLRSFLVGLAFLQQKFNPRETLINLNQYIGLAKGGFVRSLFEEISCDYLKISQELNWEFINEFNQKEVQLITKLIVPSNISTGINVLNTYTIVYTLNNIRVIFSYSNETKQVAYSNSKNFLKSIIYYGFDIEKILSLKCLEEYGTVESVKSDLVLDEKLFQYLKELSIKSMQQNNKQMKNRLKRAIDAFLDFFA